MHVFGSVSGPVETAPSDVPVAATAAESAASDEDVKTASSAVATAQWLKCTAAAWQHKRQGPSPPTVEVSPSPTTNVTCPSAPFSPFVQVDGESGINPRCEKEHPSPSPSKKSSTPKYSHTRPTQKHQTTPLLTDTGYPTSGTFKSARFAFCFEDNCQLCFLCKETLYNSQPEFEKLCYSRQCQRNPHWHEETKRCTS